MSSSSKFRLDDRSVAASEVAPKTGLPKPQPLPSNPLSRGLTAMDLGDPIAHIPPRPAIDLRPTWPKRVEPYKNCWELAAEEEEARRKAKRDEAMWRAVCDVASSRGGVPQARMPLGSTETAADALKDDEANPIADEQQNKSVNALEDELSVMVGGLEWRRSREFAEVIVTDNERGRHVDVAIKQPLPRPEWVAYSWPVCEVSWPVCEVEFPAPDKKTAWTTTQAGRPVTQDCGYWTDLYPWECDCKQGEGGIGMTTILCRMDGGVHRGSCPTCGCEPIGWQPIETAPKDEKQEILACDNRDNFYWIKIVTWAAFLGEGKWWDGEYSHCESDFTHWMPLPTPPECDCGAKEG